MSMYTLTTLHSSDWPRLGQLFERAFGQPMAAGLADYKYAHGHGESVALVDADGTVIAHCGMTFRDMLAGGRPAPGVQLGDSMVLPEARGMLARQGSPFYRVAAGALERLESLPEAPFVFGFPNDRAIRLGERLELYMEIDRICELTWPASPGAPQAQAQATGPTLRAAVDGLWRRMAADLGDALVAVRDGAYMERRYFAHPANRYHVYLLRSRWLRRPQAVFVLRSHGATVELIDWVAPLDRVPAVIAEARRAATALGGERLTAWLTCSFAPRFSADALSCTVTECRVPACGRWRADWVARFRNRVWLTGGDTDFR